MSRGDVTRNYLTPEDDQLPEEPEYDKFAYENDKKMWGLDNSFNENDGIDGLRGETRKERRLHYTSGMLTTPVRKKKKRIQNNRCPAKLTIYTHM